MNSQNKTKKLKGCNTPHYNYSCFGLFNGLRKGHISAIVLLS